jgi:hypothetical protein
MLKGHSRTLGVGAQPPRKGHSVSVDETEASRSKAARTVGVPSGDPPWEAVGEAEPCDWCGRPGLVEQFEMWTGDRVLECRNPSLCDVCSYWFQMPGDVIDAIHAAGLDEHDRVMQPFEAELCRKWREKVAQGTRRPQHPEDRSLIQTRAYFAPLDAADE